MDMTSDSIFEIVVDVVASAATVDPAALDPDADLIRDLDLDSLSLFEIVVDLEEAFDLHISDEVIEGLKTCREIAAHVDQVLNRAPGNAGRAGSVGNV